MNKRSLLPPADTIAAPGMYCGSKQLRPKWQVIVPG
jgi:hypothetical protein